MKINFDGMEGDVDLVNGVVHLTFKRPMSNIGRQFGWEPSKLAAFGLNRKWTQYIVDNNMYLAAEWEHRGKLRTCYASSKLVKTVVEKGWFYDYSKVGYNIRLYCIPVSETHRILKDAKAEAEQQELVGVT